MLATSVHGSQSMADRVLGMCSAQTCPAAFALAAGQLCSNNPVGCGQNQQSQTSEHKLAAALAVALGE
jgi:hypothetical protein